MIVHHCRWSELFAFAIFIVSTSFVCQAQRDFGSSNSAGCRFFPVSENRRFERVAENLPLGHEVFRVEVHPRKQFKLEAVDNSLSDSNYFKYEEIDDKTVAIKLAQSLEDLVDRRDPQSVLKFKLTCKGVSGTEDAFLPVTVYITDINDHAPDFQNVPYHLEVDELTPVGLTVFRGIHANDRDKPNTANSDVTYSIVGGNENRTFILSDPIEGILVVNKPLDYDNGIREFKIQIQASDHGTPVSLSSVTTMTIKVKDSDDQNPAFTSEVYKASVSEMSKITGQRIREKVQISPNGIHAYDQDTGINARLRYSIVTGNDAGFFEVHQQTGELFLVREIDLESLPNAGLTLQIQATQVDNPLRQAVARVEVFVADINDNMPEFEYDMYNITVMENLPPGFTVLQVTAQDADKGANAEFKYVLNDPSGAFKIDEKTGWISVMDPVKLDRETKDKIQMKVTAVELKPNLNPDAAKRAQISSTTIEVNLLDANDNNPTFYPSNLYTFSVLETAPSSTVAGSVFAHDNDLGENGLVVYYKQNDTISQSVPFDVHLHNGTIYVLDSFGHLPKKADQYTFFVVAGDLARSHFERRTAVAVVRINVTDINNSVPEFIGAPYEAYVGESLPEGAYVTQVMARDADSSSSSLEYSIIAGNDEKLFIIDSKHGKIFTAAVLDYEKKQSYDLLVQASDGVNTAISPLLINVVDINDNIPTFAHKSYNFSVVEEMNSNITIGSLVAVDRDSGKNAQIQYNIVGDHANDAFYIDSFTGVIRTRRRLDRETESTIDFTVTAFDSGVPQLSSTTSVRIQINDINDHPPQFDRETYEVEVPEEVSPPFNVFQLQASDLDSGDNAVVKYLILTGNEDKTFDLNPDTGMLITTERLNYERKSQYILHVAARNIRPFQGPNAIKTLNPAVQLVINIGDINDENTIFDQQSYKFHVYENTTVNTVVGGVNASNPRIESSEQVIVYWLDSNDGSTRLAMNKFAIIPSTGQIVLKGTIDRDPPANERMFRLRVFARVRDSINTFNTSVPLVITVLDNNDNAPVFTDTEFVVEIPENSPAGTIVTKLKATDIDEMDRNSLKYQILSGNEDHAFSIDENTGEISVRIIPDREKTGAYILKVQVSDGVNSAVSPLIINIVDINDNKPIFLQRHHNFSIVEEMNANITVGSVMAVDKDTGKNAEIQYQIVGEHANDAFYIDSASGLIRTRRKLDREIESLLDFKVIAFDSGVPQQRGVTNVRIKIDDINDNSPQFDQEVYTIEIPEEVTPPYKVFQLNATDKDSGDNSIVKFLILTGNEDKTFELNSDTGELVTKERLNYERKSEYTLHVAARNIRPFQGPRADQIFNPAVQLVINIRDINDEMTVFDQQSYRFQVYEKTPVNSVVGAVNASNPRRESSEQDIIYWFDTSDSNTKAAMNKFDINFRSGQIVLRDTIDRDPPANERMFRLRVFARVRNSVNMFNASVPVLITILDSNDNAPSFEKNQFTVELKENSPIGTAVTKLKATDIDELDKDALRYHIVTGNEEQVFGMEETTGEISVKNVPDREKLASYMLRIVAIDSGNNTGWTNLHITILDENDWTPTFLNETFVMNVTEGPKSIGTRIRLPVVDYDDGINRQMEVYIADGNANGEFRLDVDENGPMLSIVHELDRERYNTNDSAIHFVTVVAKDKGNPPRLGKTRIAVIIHDLNDTPPKFRKQTSDSPVYQFEVLEGNFTNNKVKLGTLNAKDDDIGKNGLIEYKILNNVAVDFPFSLDVHTGELFAKGYIDRESRETYNFEVTAIDYGEPPQNTSCEVTIKIKDVNDERPRFYTDPYLAHVPENLSPGHKVTQIAAYDPDLGENGQVFYKLGEGHENKFYIDGKDGTVWTLSSLDYEEKSFYNITIIAYDKGKPSLSSVAKLWVTVADTKDAVPDFVKAVYTIEVAENARTGDTVFTLNAGEGPFKYSLMNSDSVDTFTIDPTNGRVKVAQALDSVQRNTYRLLVKAEDDSEPPKYDTAEVNIIVGTGQGVRLFPQRFYEVTVSENHLAPQLLIDLNSTDEITHRTPHYTIVGTDFNGIFKVEPETGRLMVMRSLDRESQNLYQVKIKAEKRENVVQAHRIGKRDSSHSSAMIRPTIEAYNHHLAFDEVLVVVNVADENDNSPIFDNRGKSIVAAVPLEASFGYQVCQLHAEDLDTGVNSAIRYEIQARGDDASSKFHIDPTTGIIRSMVTFSLDGGKVFGFDVRATDREGSETGNSAVTNVFVYVLPETKMVLFVTNTEPITVEKKSKDILGYLSNVTGFDVKMAKLEPHREGDQQETHSTDLFLYAVNPDTNEIVDTDTLLDVFRQNSHLIVENLEDFRIKRIQGVTVQEKVSQMGATEVAILALSSIIFLGTVLAIALLCSNCKDRKMRKQQSTWEQQRLYSIKNPLMSKNMSTPYGQRGMPNGHSNSTYSTGEGGSEYMDSLASYKRHSAAGAAAIAPGARLIATTGALNKSRQQTPPDGASALNPPRSPRFTDRYRHVVPGASGVGPASSGATTRRASKSDEQAATEWFSKEEGNESVVSGYSRASGRSGRSGYSGASGWSLSRKSREPSPATEL